MLERLRINREGWRLYVLYAITIFISAFLLFQIQPIAGKHILPRFGGSSSVWAASLLFFSGTLFFGYLYVYVLARFSRWKQITIHLAVLLLVSCASIAALVSWHTIFPPLQWTVGNTVSPWLEVLLALGLSVGGPYLLLSTTGPLLQYWYGVTTDREPYTLYAISNVGSLLALSTYPFLVEPWMTLDSQKGVWVIAFFAYAALLALVCRTLWQDANTCSEVQKLQRTAAVTVRDKVMWILLAALPSLMLVATTTQITHVVAPMPLLWLLPLCVYLITFIVAFWGYGGGRITWFLLLVSSAIAYAFLDSGFHQTAWRVISDLLLLFFVGMFCHAQLYQRGPAAEHSPLFYVMISLGGTVGALFSSIVASVVFTGLWEFPLGILMCVICAIVLVPRGSRGRMRPITRAIARGLLVTVIAIAIMSWTIKEQRSEILAKYRNFYGSVTVHQVGNVRALMHGATVHGLQFTDPQYEFTPSTYYTAKSGVARAIMDQYLRNRDRTLKIGVIGLGVAAISTYCGSGDTYVFYEINPQIIDSARKYFTYLERCPGAEIRLGDARIVLEEERRARVKNDFDVLVMNAFNDDTVPTHLMTKEAIQLYLSHLRSDKSVLAIHTSNNYLKLAPVIISIAEDLGLTWIVVANSGEDSVAASPSEWVLVSPSPDAFLSGTYRNVDTSFPEERVRVWTDDYTDVWSLVRIPFDIKDAIAPFKEK